MKRATEKKLVRHKPPIQIVTSTIRIVSFKSNTTGVTWGAGTANLSGAPDCIPGFYCGLCCSIFSFLFNFVDLCFSFCAFSFGHCVICQTFLKNIFWIHILMFSTVNHRHIFYGNFWHLCHVTFTHLKIKYVWYNAISVADISFLSICC